MKKLIKRISFRENTPIRTLIRSINDIISLTDGKAFAVIVNKSGECVGTVTDGDIRRFLAKNSINNKVSKVMRKEFFYVPDYYSKHRILKEFDIVSNKTDFKIKTLPVLNKNRRVVDIINYSKFLQKKNFPPKIEKFRRKKITVKIPGRISFAGGGLDFTKVILKNTINILSVSVNKYCKVKVENRKDYKIFVYEKKKLILKTDLQNVYKIKNLIASTIDFCKINQGVNIYINSDIPKGSGLGGSSALTIALIYALKRLQTKKNPNIYNVIDNAFFAERIKFKVYGGWQDFYGTAFGGFKWITLNKLKNKVEVLKVNKDTFSKIQKYLIFFKFGNKRSSGLINKKISISDFKLSEIKDMNEISYRLKKLLGENKVLSFLKVVGKSWILKKSLNPRSLTKKIRYAEKDAKKNGAISYKVLGAGRSGFFMVGSLPKNHRKIITSLKKYNFKYEKIKFENKGLSLNKK